MLSICIRLFMDERLISDDMNALAQIVKTLVQLNEKLLEGLPPVYDASWKKLVMNDDQESLLTANQIYACGMGNVLSLAALRVAQLRSIGRQAVARVTLRRLPDQTLFVSCQVVLGEDPSDGKGELDEWFEELRSSSGKRGGDQ